MPDVKTILTENIDTWTTAQAIKNKGRGKKADNQSQYGIKKLRELILELAVRGKLVPQDPNEEPASILLEKIATEKAQLIKEGKIKKQKKLPEITEDEKPFELPKGWEWNRFDSIFQFIDYRGKTPKKVADGYRLITAKNIRMGYLSLEPQEFVTEETYRQWMTRGFPQKGDLLFTTEAPMGNVCMVELKEPFALAQRSINLHPFCKINSCYLMFSIMSPLVQLLINDKSSGMTARGIKAAKLKTILLPIPPLAEQHRIVAKVDELMTLCDQLEQEQDDSNKAHDILVDTLLSTLTSASDQADLEASWQRIAANFDILFTTEESIDKLKQTILQLAVMGKLVPQDPNDEPASILLEKIATEKAKLIKEGKIKKQKKLSEITEEEMPFELPDGWRWSKCQDICYKITDGEHSTPKRSDSGFYLLSARNVTNEGIILNDVDYVPKSEFERIRKRCDPNIGDILISCSGSVGRIALVDRDNAYSMVRSAAMIRPDNNFLLKEFITIMLRSPYLQNQIEKRSKQSAQSNLFLGAISNLVAVIPPLTEQHRIIAKVDELLAICDKLKTKISESQTTQLQLADAIVDQTLKSDKPETKQTQKSKSPTNEKKVVQETFDFN